MSQLISGDADLCALVTFPWSAHFYLAFSGDGCVLFHLYFHRFNSLLGILWRIKCNLFIQWKSVLYCVNFEVINRDIFGIIHAINWINSLQCWINTRGGYHITKQVGVFSFFIQSFIGWFCTRFFAILVLFCPHLDSFIVFQVRFFPFSLFSPGSSYRCL